jgi:hypothetical protein
MNVKEFSAAVAVAKSGVDLSREDIDIFMGFGLRDFAPVYCTVPQVARLIRWQSGTFAGGWDSEMMNEVAHFGRKRFIIV